MLAITPSSQTSSCRSNSSTLAGPRNHRCASTFPPFTFPPYTGFGGHGPFSIGHGVQERCGFSSKVSLSANPQILPLFYLYNFLPLPKREGVSPKEQLRCQPQRVKRKYLWYKIRRTLLRPAGDIRHPQYFSWSNCARSGIRSGNVARITKTIAVARDRRQRLSSSSSNRNLLSNDFYPSLLGVLL